VKKTIPVTEKLASRQARAEEQINQMILRGIVTQVDGATYRVKAWIPAQNIETFWLQVLTVKAHRDKYAALPDIDEQVLILFIPGAPETGYVLGCIYSDPNPPPPEAPDPDITMIKWGEGGWFRHNRKTGDVDLHVTGKLTIAVEKDILIGSSASIHGNAAAAITLKAPSEITLGGASEININSTAHTKIVGSTQLTAGSLASTTLYSLVALEAKAGLDLSVKSGLNLDAQALNSIKLAAGTDLLASAGARLAAQGMVAAQFGSPAMTEVGGGAILRYGAGLAQLSGVNQVAQAETVSSTVTPQTPAPIAPAIPLPPFTTAADLPPDTVVEPLPIEPEPYQLEAPPAAAGRPDPPGPVEGPGKEWIK
jgi:phage baseplate assembly protein V